MQGTMPGAHRWGRPHTAWTDNIKTWAGLPVEESVRMTEDRQRPQYASFLALIVSNSSLFTAALLLPLLFVHETGRQYCDDKKQLTACVSVILWHPSPKDCPGLQKQLQQPANDNMTPRLLVISTCIWTPNCMCEICWGINASLYQSKATIAWDMLWPAVHPCAHVSCKLVLQKRLNALSRLCGTEASFPGTSAPESIKLTTWLPSHP